MTVPPFDGPHTFGPYNSEVEARREPMPAAVGALHQSGRVRSGDPDQLVHNLTLDHLLGACRDAGVELGLYDQRVLHWLCRWEDTTVQVVIGLVTRAYAAGRAGTQNTNDKEN